MSKSNDKSNSVQDENDIDALLDDALEDFNKPLPSVAAQKSSNATQGSSSSNSPSAPAGSLLTEEMIKEATQNFEASMRAIMLQQQKVAEVQQLHSAGSGGSSTAAQAPASSTQLDLQSLTSQFAQFAQSATNVANSSNAAPSPAADAASADNTKPKSQEEVPDFQNLLTDAMQQMAQNSKAFQSAPSAEELSQLMSGLGLGGGQEGEGSNLMTLMQSMLENVLSKEIIYPPIKEIVDKYPDWLADHRSSIEAADFDRYSRQFDVMKKIVDLFEAESESDSDEVKAKRFEDLVGLMQKLQEEGHPPPELAGEVPPHLANMASQEPGSGDGGMPDLGAMMGSLAAAMGDPSKAPNANDEQCSLM